MNDGQRRGAIAITIGFVLVALGGFALSFVAGGVLTPTQVVMVGILFFLVVSPIFGYGIYTYAKFSEASALATNDEMEKPRLLLDMLREHPQADIHILANQLETTPEMIVTYIDDLARLDLFTGIVDVDNAVLAIVEPVVLNALESCKTCSAAILVQDGITVCATCGTRYYRS